MSARLVGSLRGYLLSRLLLGTAAVLLAAGLAVYLLVARSLERQFDANLADRVQALASLLFQVEDELDFAFSDQLMPEYSTDSRPDYFELVRADGREVERSDSLGTRHLELPAPTTRELSFWTAPLPDGRTGRFASQRVFVHHVFPEEGPGRPTTIEVNLVIARGREGLVSALRTVLLQCAGAALLLVALLALVALRTVSRGLEPAERLAAALGKLDVERLPERLEAGPVPRELEPIARTADELIGRVALALERERRTTADIAHELRTPISELLTVSEVALRNGRDPEHTRQSLGLVRDVASRMGRTLSTLLKLARLEMGAETFHSQPLQLAELLAEVRRPLASLERERGLSFECNVAVQAEVEADPDVLRIVLSNLVGNAVHHAPIGSTLSCRLERDPQSWRLVVENEAEGLTEADLRSMDEPFWRKDGARSDREHSGLGLALSRSLAARGGLELRFELAGPRRFRAVLEPNPSIA